MSDSSYHNQIRGLIQQDVGGRGLTTDPEENLFTVCRDDFANACHSIAEHPRPEIAIVTGFYIPTANPPAAETDGPLGALYLARALTPLDIRVHLVTDQYCLHALEVGLRLCNLQNQVKLWNCADVDPKTFTDLTHLIALERAGPNHTEDSISEEDREDFCKSVSIEQRNQCYSMRGRPLSEWMGNVHEWFEHRPNPRITTIGIGDGGNEIGMGKIPWSVIRRNVPNGGLVHCRIATDYLIVAGVSNWGAYALSWGVYHLRNVAISEQLLNSDMELSLLEEMVNEGPLVDGIVGKQQATVDTLTWDQYTSILQTGADLFRTRNSNKAKP